MLSTPSSQLVRVIRLTSYQQIGVGESVLSLHELSGVPIVEQVENTIRVHANRFCK